MILPSQENPQQPLPAILERGEKTQLNLPAISTMKRFDFSSVGKMNKKLQINKNKLLANIRSISAKRKQLLDDQQLLNLSRKKERKTLNKTYKHVKPKYLERMSENDSRKTFLPVLNSLTTLIENDLQSAKVLNNYKIISHVGKGCFSVVSAAIHKETQKKYAIKTYTRIDQMDDIKIKNIQAEIKNLFKINHENIISLSHAAKDGRKIQLIMENGGKQSLAGLLRKTKCFDENLTKFYFKQIISGIAHCHEKNICHRDIKLQNILVDDNGKVKIIDFGFSSFCNSHSRLVTLCGTPPYMSPQLAARQPYNGLAADIWALGVCFFLMLNGKFPFRAPDEKQLYRLIQQGKYKYISEVSPAAKNLLERMFKTDENQRITAQQILNHQWLCS